LITYRVRLDVPRELSCSFRGSWLGTAKEIGTRKGARSLGCYRQALFGLAWYRDKPDIPRLGAGSGLSQATSYRYVAEITKVVAAEAPDLEEALERTVAEGTPYMILGGMIVSSDRCHERTVSRKGREIDLVLREEGGLWREHPGPVRPGRPADVDFGRTAGQCP
jgi:hypothetical protein